MSRALNPEKSRKLRPVRIIIAFCCVILATFLIIKSRKESAYEKCGKNCEISANNREETTKNPYFYFEGFSELVEHELETKLSRLGVPEEDFDSPGEYLSKDELYILDKKSELAAKLDEKVFEATAEDLKRITDIFGFEDFEPLNSAPDEYESLKVLLDAYQKSLNTVEDYDIMET